MVIVFCTPHGGCVSPEHYRRKLMVQAAAGFRHQFLYAEVDTHVVSKARNMLVEKALEQEQAELLWFVDSDILLPPNALDLLEYVSDEHPVVSGVYFSRSYPHLPSVYNRGSAREIGDPHAYFPLVQLPGEPFEADGVGAGCLVVRRDVFIRLREEWETWVGRTKAWAGANIPPEEWAVRRALDLAFSMSPWFEFVNLVGEDLYFCERVREVLGRRILVVPSVICEHEGKVPIGLGHYRATLQSGPLQMVADGVTGGRR